MRERSFQISHVDSDESKSHIPFVAFKTDLQWDCWDAHGCPARHDIEEEPRPRFRPKNKTSRKVHLSAKDVKTMVHGKRARTLERLEWMRSSALDEKELGRKYKVFDAHRRHLKQDSGLYDACPLSPYDDHSDELHSESALFESICFSSTFNCSLRTCTSLSAKAARSRWSFNSSFASNSARCASSARLLSDSNSLSYASIRDCISCSFFCISMRGSDTLMYFADPSGAPTRAGAVAGRENVDIFVSLYTLSIYGYRPNIHRCPDVNTAGGGSHADRNVSPPHPRASQANPDLLMARRQNMHGNEHEGLPSAKHRSTRTAPNLRCAHVASARAGTPLLQAARTSIRNNRRSAHFKNEFIALIPPSDALTVTFRVIRCTCPAQTTRHTQGPAAGPVCAARTENLHKF